MISTKADADALLPQVADPQFFLQPEFTQLMSYLRKNDPICWAEPWPDRGCWVVTRHIDIKEIYGRHEDFRNGVVGTLIPADPNAHKTNREVQGFDALLANTDQPRHGQLRRVFAKYFSGPHVARLEGRCQAITDDIIDDLQDRDEFDFVKEAATHLPAYLICELLGVPEEDWPLMTKYVNSLACYTDPEYQLGATPAETFAMAMRLSFEYVAKLVAARRTDPRDDLCSLAATAEIGGAPPSDRDASWGAWQMLAGGFETSRNVIAGGLLALIENPAQMALLKADPGLMNSAIEEMLRWTQPVTATVRTAARDTEIAGQKIAEGDWMLLVIESANRDETVFDNPHDFDITRRPNLYLSFGHGIHNCIGRMLAVLEVKVMLRTMLARTESIEIAGPIEYRSSTIAKGLKSFPIRVKWKS